MDMYSPIYFALAQNDEGHKKIDRAVTLDVYNTRPPRA